MCRKLYLLSGCQNVLGCLESRAWERSQLAFSFFSLFKHGLSVDAALQGSLRWVFLMHLWKTSICTYISRTFWPWGLHSLWQNKVFSAVSKCFQPSIVVQKSVSVGRHFSGLPSPSDGEIICLLPGGVEEGKLPHFRGGFCCCRRLHCVLAYVPALGHDAGRVTSTMARATHCICPHLCKSGLRPCAWIWGALSSRRWSLQSRGAAFQTCHFYRA